MNSYEEYINQIKSNEILSCELIKLAVSRTEYFLQRDDIYYDEEAVKEVIDFVENIKHYTGKHYGKPFTLNSWQKYFVANIFGFKYKSTNKRVTKTVSLSMSRKNGKSALIMSICLYLLCADPTEHAPFITIVSKTAKQSQEIFKLCSGFSASLDPKGKILKQYLKNVRFSPNMGEIKVVSSEAKALEGFDISCAVLDEAHTYSDYKLMQVCSNAQGNREQPLMFIISTVSDNQFTPYYEIFQNNIEVLKNIIKDDSQFSMLFTYDDEDLDDFENPELYIKSNPNLNITTTSDYITERIQKAKHNPILLNDVKNKLLNIWTTTSSNWINQKYIIDATKDFDLDFFKNKEELQAFVGVDLSKNADLTAVSFLIPYENKLYFINKYYLPEACINEHADHELYKKWVANNSLTITTGNVTDYNYIIDDIVNFNEKIQIYGIYYDPYNAGEWSSKMSDIFGYQLYTYPQNVASFNKPTKAIERNLLSGNIILQNNEITRFCYSNVVIKKDHNGNEKPDKEKSKNKIDGVIANCMSVAGFLQHGNSSFNVSGFNF